MPSETAKASLGYVTAYGAAKRGGYLGTYEEWCALMAEVADHLEQNESLYADTTTAKEAAEAAQGYAEVAQGKAEDAQTAAETAQGKAEDAEDAAEAWAAGTSGGTPSATNNASYYAGQASDSATASAASAASAEAWATGGSSGTSSATNNAKYYSDQAEASAEAAEAWATGGSSGTPSATNNAKYWSEQAKETAEDIEASSAQIAQNAADVAELKTQLNGKTYINETFENGSYQENGTEIAGNRWIRCPLFTVEKSTVMRVNDGWEYSAWFYDTDGSTRLYTVGYIQSDNPLYVAKGDKIKIGIHKKDNSYIMGDDIITASKQVYFDNTYLPKIEKELLHNKKQLISEDMRVGMVNDSGVVTNTGGYVCNKDIMQYNRRVLVHADEGYYFIVSYYDDNNDYVGKDALSKYEIAIPENTKFRITIRKATYSETDLDVLSFIAHVNISAFPLENRHEEWWDYLFGIAHTGAEGTYPANTIISFKYAIKEWGMKMVESDLRFTSDNVPILLHNATINQTARNADGTTIETDVYIANITYTQALEYDFGLYMGEEFAGTKIGNLEDLLKLCHDTGTYLVMDIKAMTVAQSEIFVQMIKEHQMEDKIIIATTSGGLTYYRYIWQYLNYPLHTLNTLTIPAGGLDDDIKLLQKYNKNGNIMMSLQKTQYTNTTEINKLINAGIRILNATNMSDEGYATLPPYVNMSSGHSDMQTALRAAALAD